MISLDNVSTDDLRQVLAEVEGKKPTQWVMAAINYLEDDEATLEEVAERYGYTAGWLSSWLDRLEQLVGDSPSGTLPSARVTSILSVESLIRVQR